MMFDDTLISIHAPTRGATILCNHRRLVFGFQSTLPREERLSFPCNISFHLIFQSTLPREERPRFDAVCQVSASFQSTLPREERQSSPRLSCQSYYFNPRSHERSDVSLVVTSIESAISIHAPTRGATVTIVGYAVPYLFQSTLPREERRSFIFTIL